MDVFVVHCHPEPKSFNSSMKDLTVSTFENSGHDVEVSDLYAEGFDPVEKGTHYTDRQDPEFFAALSEQRHAFKVGAIPEDVRREINRLERADLVVFQFPLWWHAQPAMLKGWFDRVFLSGGIYTSSMRYDRGYFRDKRALCCVTTGAPETSFGKGARGGDIEQLLWPLHYSLHYVGFGVLPPFIAFGVQGHGYSYQGEDAFKDHLAREMARLESRIQGLEQDSLLTFPGWQDWNDDGSARHSVIQTG